MKSKIVWIYLGLWLSFSGFAQENCTLSYAKHVKYLKIPSGETIAYRESGKGQTLLLVHGLGGNLSHWNRNFDELSKHFRVIAIDLPNYGLSSKQDSEYSEGTLVYYTTVISSFIKNKKLKKVTLLGHSMGGQTAILTALYYPKLISKLILAAPAGIETFTDNEAKMLLLTAKPEIFKAQQEQVVRQSFALNFVKVPREAEVLVADRLMLPKCKSFDEYWKAVAQGVEGMLKNTVFTQLGEVKQPTLILFGDKDSLIPNRYLHPSLNTQQVAKLAHEKILNSSMQLIPEAGHLLMFEQPDVFNQNIIKFLMSNKN